MNWDAKSTDSDARRVVFPRSVKNQLFMAQKGKCLYCGRSHRIHYLEIDHKYPLSRGCGNEIDNLQLLCTPCNMRKGIQSDDEFRRRYWRVLPDDGGIPRYPIPQDYFVDETRSTRATREVRGIYRRRFSNYRRNRRDGFGLLVASVVLAIVVLPLLDLLG